MWRLIVAVAALIGVFAIGGLLLSQVRTHPATSTHYTRPQMLNAFHAAGIRLKHDAGTDTYFPAGSGWADHAPLASIDGYAFDVWLDMPSEPQRLPQGKQMCRGNVCADFDYLNFPGLAQILQAVYGRLP